MGYLGSEVVEAEPLIPGRNFWLVDMSPNVITLSGVPREELPRIVKRLIAWRKRNGLSQRAAVEVMRREGYPVALPTLRSWEHGQSRPGELVSKALEIFLTQHATIRNPPKYGRWLDHEKGSGRS